MEDIFEGSANTIADVALVRGHLVAAARRRKAVSYSELLIELGHRFTRPKMRALCRTLDAIDEAGVASSEPGLAVLVVREADGLPGQGWWTGKPPRREGWDGPWTGPNALAFVEGLQARAFDHWSTPRNRVEGRGGGGGVLPTTGAVLGVDVGYSPKRRSSAVCRLDFTGETVTWVVERFRAVEPERTVTLQRLADRPLLAAAFDGPLQPGFEAIGHYREAERLLTRGVGRRIGKPGSSGSPGGRLLNAATNTCAKIVRATGHLAPARHAEAIDATAIVEAFPTAYLGLLIETPEALPPVKRGTRTDVYFKNLVDTDRLDAMLADLLPTRILAESFAAVVDHDERAALTCTLAALGVAANAYSAVGDNVDGWIVLPPRAMWADWAKKLAAA